MLSLNITLGLNLIQVELYKKSWRGPSPIYSDPVMRKHAIYLNKSYKRIMGQNLIDCGIDDESLFDKLYNTNDRSLVFFN